MIEQFDDGRMQFGHDQIAQAHRIDQASFIIDHIKLIERLALFAHLAQMRQHVGDRPILLNGDVFRCHPAANRIFRVAEQVGGDFSLLR